MRKILTSVAIAGCLIWGSPVTAESRLSEFLQSGIFQSDVFQGELFQSEVISAAVSTAAETVLTEWLSSDDESEATDVDPLEKYNRFMFRLNSKLDSKALKPLAESYVEYTPAIVRTGVRNFFGNIGDVGVAANSAMQGKVDQALSDSSRVAINSVVGLGGVFDVATALEIEKNHEDFGQTLAVWGVPEGPYIVLPLLGPRTLRGAVGTAVDTFIQVETLGSVSELAGAESALSEMLAFNLIDQRTRLLGTESLLEQASLDPYLFAREAYLARRRCMVEDCDKIDYVAADPEIQTNAELEELDLLDELDMLDELDVIEE